MSIAIVTGASSGLGAEFCRRLDSLGLDCIWLVARRADRLEAVASGLKTPSITISADLSTEEGLSLIRDRLSESGPEIMYLFNCAGFGRFGTTWGIDAEQTRSMIDLNITSLVEISSMCIPFMKGGSTIVEICSASAYLSLYRLNVYASTKAFVRSFCKGLRYELSAAGINVLEVSPGWIDTDFISLSTSGSEVPPKVFKHLLTVDQVVDRTMRDLGKGRRRSIPGLYYRFQIALCSHFPGIAERVWLGYFR